MTLQPTGAADFRIKLRLPPSWCGQFKAKLQLYFKNILGKRHQVTPLYCNGLITLLHFDELTLEFGTIPVGYAKKAYRTLHNGGKIDAKLKVINLNSNLICSKTSFTLPKKKSIKIAFTWTPTREVTRPSSITFEDSTGTTLRLHVKGSAGFPNP